ncbi:MAG: EthD family reductase [Candidatus Rokuibacteriota bacterium]
MIRVSVMYPSGPEKTFDHGYYAQKHMPMVSERLRSFGLVRYEIDKGIAGGAPGAPAPLVAVVHLYFNALADFQKGMATHGKEIMADVPNDTNISLQVQISEIVG